MTKFNKLNKYEIKRMELEVEELKESLRLFQQREEAYKMELKELQKQYRESERYKDHYWLQRDRKSREIEKLNKEIEELKNSQVNKSKDEQIEELQKEKSALSSEWAQRQIEGHKEKKKDEQIETLKKEIEELKEKLAEA